ncbi:MAG: hypothetical protein AAB706_04250, partial [Patescibacteria group bacterium]
DLARFLKNGGNLWEYADKAQITHEEADKIRDEIQNESLKKLLKIGMDASEDPDGFPDFVSFRPRIYADSQF